MFPPGRVETLQRGFQNIEPPDPVGNRTPEAGFAQRIVRFDHAGDLGHAFATTKRTARGEQGQVAVGFTSSAPFNPFVPRIIRVYREAFPLVSLTLEEGGTTELIDDLRNERIDAAFIRTAIANREGIAVSTLLHEAMVLALPRGHVLSRRGDALALKALASETFIVYRRRSGPGLYDAILAACTAAGFSPRIGQEAPRIVSTLNLVAAGLGISLVPESLQRMSMLALRSALRVSSVIARSDGPLTARHVWPAESP